MQLPPMAPPNAPTKARIWQWRSAPGLCFSFAETSRRRLSEALADQLHRHRGRLAAADAERGDALAAAMGLQRRQQSREDARAARADRKAERGGAAMDVDLVVRDAEIVHRDHRDAGEGLVDLIAIDLGRRPAGLS